LRIRLTEHAVRDIEQAREHYAVISSELGDRFVAELEATVGRLEMFPNGAPPVEGFDGIRRARMRRFPYGIFYRYTAETELQLLRVLHSQRDHPDALDDTGS